MDKVKLDVQTRDLAASLRGLREGKLIPAVFYGKGEKNIPLQVDYQTFRRLYMKSGSQLIDLVIDGQTNKKALVHQLQYDPLSGKIKHIDFLRVSLKETITTEVPVEIIGVAPAVKDLGGIMNVVKDNIAIKCLPTDIPKQIEVDVTKLIEFNDSIHVSELAIPEGVEVLDVPEDVVVIVNPPTIEKEPEPVEGEEGAEGVEGEVGAEGEGKEGEAAEGEAKDGDGGEDGGDKKD